MNFSLERQSSGLCFFNWTSVRGTFASILKASLKKILIAAALVSAGISAQTISPQMLQQLNSMPRAQQEALAKQYGVDLDQILGGGGAAGERTELARPGESLEQRRLGRSDKEREENREFLQEKLVNEFEQYLIDKDKKVERYGVSLFDKDISTFAPTDDASVPADYRLGVGDNLVIQLFGTESSKYELQVTREGMINFPELGPLSIAGLTYEDARELIQTLVMEQLFGAQATISMGRLRSINIFMAGEVSAPGAYSVSALTTITQALFQAGGIGDIGSLRNIQVKRGGVKVKTFDVYQLLMRGDASGDIRLQSGDVVFVPPYTGIITIEGAVKRPMIYEFIDGESVLDAIAMAGGLNQDAYDSAIAVVSKGIGKSLPSAKNIDLNLLKSGNIGLRNGDKIRVPESTDNLENAVTLEGAVVRPGVYGWVEGQRVSDLLSSVASDLKSYADLDYGLVVRQKNQRLDIEVMQVNLGNALGDVTSEDNILTAPRDKIIVFGLPSVIEISALDAANKELEKLKSKLKQIKSANRYESNNYSQDLNQRSAGQYYSDTDVDIDADADTDADADADADADSDTDLNPDSVESKAVERLKLLKPVIEKLKSQARSGEPVQIVSISGAVKLPGDYPLGMQDTVAQLVTAAGGLKDSAYLDSAELSSLHPGRNKEILSRYRNINLGAELRSKKGTALQSRDHLYVKELPDWNPTNAVSIEGEVRFPGMYRIRKNERLADVIERAGGLTQMAFPSGAVFTRQSIAKLENVRSKQFAQSIIRDFASSQLTKEDNSITIEEIQSIAEILENFERAGRLLVNVQAAMSGDSLANIVLEDGDTLRIPEQNSTVTVVGEIRRPGTHTFQAGLDLDDYLGLSAGLTDRAEDKELYIVRADGSVLRPTTSWFRFAENNELLSPGDTIVVPIDGGYTDNLTLWREVTQVVFNTTSGLASMILVTR